MINFIFFQIAYSEQTLVLYSKNIILSAWIEQTFVQN